MIFPAAYSSCSALENSNSRLADLIRTSSALELQGSLEVNTRKADACVFLRTCSHADYQNAFLCDAADIAYSPVDDLPVGWESTGLIGLPRTFEEAPVVLFYDANLKRVESISRPILAVQSLGERLLNLVEMNYQIPDRPSIARFLSRFPFLVTPLIEGAPKLKRHFDRSAPCVLRVVKEPDSADGDELFAFVQTSLMPEQALERLRNFDEEWWLQAVSSTKSRLNFSLEFL